MSLIINSTVESKNQSSSHDVLESNNIMRQLELYNSNKILDDDILNSLYYFLDVSSETMKYSFCSKTDLRFTWEIMIKSRNHRTKTKALKILSNIIEEDDNIFDFIYQDENILLILDLIDQPQTDLVDAAFMLLSTMCKKNDDVIIYLLNNNVTEKLSLCQVSLNYGQLILQLSKIPSQYMDKLVSLANLSLYCDYTCVIQDLLSALGVMYQICDNMNYKELNKRIEDNIFEYLNHLGNMNCISVYNQLILLFSLFNEVPLLVPNFVLDMMEKIYSSELYSQELYLPDSHVKEYNDFFLNSIQYFLDYHHYFDKIGPRIVDVLFRLRNGNPYNIQVKIARAIVTYYGETTSIIPDILNFLIDFIKDEDTGVMIINLLTSLVRKYPNTKESSTLVIYSYDAIKTALYSSNEELNIAASEFIDICKGIEST